MFYVPPSIEPAKIGVVPHKKSDAEYYIQHSDDFSSDSIIAIYLPLTLLW